MIKAIGIPTIGLSESLHKHFKILIELVKDGEIFTKQHGLKEIFSGFKKVMTVEINYSDELTDPYITEENRRRGQLTWLLRAHTLVDVDCWTRVPGEPLQPGKILQAIHDKLPNGDK